MKDSSFWGIILSVIQKQQQVLFLKYPPENVIKNKLFIGQFKALYTVQAY